MELSIYNFISLFCNLINAYILYKFFNLFFKEKRFLPITEYTSYFLFFIINSSISLIMNIPLVILFVNILGNYFLTYNYKAEQKDRIFLTLFFCLMSMLIETFIVLVSTTIPIDILKRNSYMLIEGPVFTTIFIYLFVSMIGKWKKVTKQVRVPFFHWIMLLLIPLSSLFIIINIMIYGKMSVASMSTCSLLFLLINLSAFNLYDMVLNYLFNKIEKQHLEQQIFYYNNQLENMKLSLESTHALKHDLTNHYIVVNGLLKNKKYDELDKYIKNGLKDTKVLDMEIYCGNTTIDSILNFKFQEAKNKDIHLATEVTIPNLLKISPSDLVVILGNLLDNAIEAVAEVKGPKEIHLKIYYDKGCLFIYISNPYNGKILLKQNKILTTKGNKELHGIGLNNIRNTVEKNGGSMNIHFENQTFFVEMMLYDHLE